MPRDDISENLENFWPEFENPDLLLYEDAGGAASTESLAEMVLNTYGIDFVGNGGGPLLDIDIKSMDCLEAIRASLLEEYADTTTGVGNVYYQELIVNDAGFPEFKRIGYYSPNLNDYILFSMPTFSRTYTKSSVIVTGKKPRQVRRLGGKAAADGDPDTKVWLNLIQLPDTESELEDYEAKPYLEDAAANTLADDLKDGDELFTNPTIWDMSSIKAPECKDKNIRQHLTITYDDPHLIPAGSTGWKDGVTSLYEQDSPFQRILGYVWDIDWGSQADLDTKITFEKISQ